MARVALPSGATKQWLLVEREAAALLPGEATLVIGVDELHPSHVLVEKQGAAER